MHIQTVQKIRRALRSELKDFFSSVNLQSNNQTDEIGRGAVYASRITGKAVSTIYDLVHKRLIPHSKQGKDLYFSRAELTSWLMEAKGTASNCCQIEKLNTGPVSKTGEES